MRHVAISIGVAIGLVISGSACANRHPDKYVSSACPLPGELRGYPVAASSSAPVDTAFLGRVARGMSASLSGELESAEQREPTPVVARLMSATLDRGDVFERHGWRPAPGDTARLLVTYRPGQPAPDVALARAGSATSFEALVERAALSAVANAREMPGAPRALPLTLAVPNAEPVAIEVAFGSEAANAPSALARFSIHEAKVLPMPGNQVPTYPTNARAAGYEGDVKIAFIVRADSTADLSSVHVIQSSRPDFATAVVHSLARARYAPAEIDCKLVPTVVVQPFSFRIDHQLLSDQ